MARLGWGFLLCAWALCSPALGAPEKGRLRRIAYVLHPGQAGSSGSRHQRPALLGGRQQQQQQQQRSFNLQLHARYGGGTGSLERSRRMSKPPVPLRLSPAGPHGPHSPAASFAKPARFGPRHKAPPSPQANSSSSSSAGLPLRNKGEPPPTLSPLCSPRRVNVCGGQCCHGWSKATGSQRCIKRDQERNCLFYAGPDTSKEVLTGLPLVVVVDTF
uniref:Uncharacterized protein n=1 Tax=Anas platyrhynchos platyrhynchos TaxID=8840 RepID=A0A493TBB5_ANAPP